MTLYYESSVTSVLRAKEHKTLFQPGPEPRSLEPESGSEHGGLTSPGLPYNMDPFVQYRFPACLYGEELAMVEPPQAR